MYPPMTATCETKTQKYTPQQRKVIVSRLEEYAEWYSKLMKIKERMDEKDYKRLERYIWTEFDPTILYYLEQ